MNRAIQLSLCIFLFGCAPRKTRQKTNYFWLKDVTVPLFSFRIRKFLGIIPHKTYIMFGGGGGDGGSSSRSGSRSGI